MVVASILRGLAGVLAASAGVYLVTRRGADDVTHGVGVFFVACGLFMVGGMLAGMYGRDANGSHEGS